MVEVTIVRSPARGTISPLLRMAASSGADEAVKLHIERGSEVDAADSRGRTALMLAAQRGHLSTCRLLLEAGATPGLLDAEGLDARALCPAAVRPGLDALIAEFHHVPADTTWFLAESWGGGDAVALDDASLDISGWEEEPEPEPPPEDPQPAVESAAVQQVLSDHEPIDRDADWRDVAVDLPIIRRSQGRSEEVDEEALAHLRAFLAEGFFVGAVTRTRLLEVVEKTGMPPDEIEPVLEATLEEFCIPVEDFEPWADPSSIGGEDQEGLNDLVEDALDFLLGLSSELNSIYWTYYHGLPKADCDREEERFLGRQMRSGQNAVLDALRASPELLDTLDSLLSDHDQIEEQSHRQGSSLQTEPARHIGQFDEAVNRNGRALVAHLRQGLAGQTGRSRPIHVTAALELAAAARAAIGSMAHLLHQENAAGSERALFLDGYRRWSGAWRKMVESNLRLVVHMTKKSWRGGERLDDLIQEGNTGLMRAAEKFDPERGFSFGTYAAWWVRARTSRYVSRRTLVRRSAFSNDVRGKIRSARQRLEGTATEVSVERLAEEVGCSVAMVMRALDTQFRFLPLLDPGVDSDEEWDRPDEQTTDPETAAITGQACDLLGDALVGLKARQAHVISLRFGLGGVEPHTLTEIGKTIDLSRERVRQIERAALKEMRAYLLLRGFPASQQEGEGDNHGT